MTLQLPHFNDLNGTMAKAYEDMNAALSGYVNAATQSHSAAWQGFETLTRDVSTLMQETYARAVDAGTTLLSVKSPQQAVETHSDFMKDCYEGLIAGGGKCVETTIHTAKGAIDPLAKHTSDTLSTLMKKTGAA